MPAPIATPECEREQLANWWRGRMEQIEREHEERVRILREGGEHPSPIFAKQVKMMGALGMPKGLVCKILCLSPYNLQTHYADEYEQGSAEIIAQVAANMIRIGTSVSDPANAKVGMDILSRRGGEEWRPPAQKVEMKDEREQPKNVIDSSRLTADERMQLRQMIERVQEGDGDTVEQGEVE